MLQRVCNKIGVQNPSGNSEKVVPPPPGTMSSHINGSGQLSHLIATDPSSPGGKGFQHAAKGIIEAPQRTGSLQQPARMHVDRRAALESHGIYEARGYPTQSDDFSKGADGRLRRHGVKAMNPMHTPANEYIDFDPSIVRDAPQSAILEEYGGFHLDPTSREQSFRVGGRTIVPTRFSRDNGYFCWSIDCYLLSSGKWIVPQNHYFDAEDACEWMLRLEGATQATVPSGDELATVAVKVSGNTMQSILEQLHAKSKALNKPYILKRENQPFIIDALERDSDAWLISIREPYHGSYQKIKVSSLEFEGIVGMKHGKCKDVTISFIASEKQRQAMDQRKLEIEKVEAEIDRLKEQRRKLLNSSILDD